MFTLARQLARAQTKTSEQSLSRRELAPKGVLALRKLLTERAFENYREWNQAHPDDVELARQYTTTSRIARNLKCIERDFDSVKSRLQFTLALLEAIPDVARERRRSTTAYRRVYKCHGRLSA